jgi:serine/threonine protein phosphatase 1
MQHYVIGDVHGEYDALMRLVSKLPKDAKLIFIGDLVDIGSRS